MYMCFPGVKNQIIKPRTFSIAVHQAPLMFLWAKMPDVSFW